MVRESLQGEISRSAASVPLLIHQLQPLTEPFKECSLQFRPSPMGHDGSVGCTVNHKHIPRPSDQPVHDGMRRVGQSSIVNTLSFPENKQVVLAKDTLPYCFREGMTYWQDNGCHCENTGTTPPFLYTSSRSFPFWIAWMKSGNGRILARSYEHIAQDRVYNGKLRKCETLGVKPHFDSWSGTICGEQKGV